MADASAFESIIAEIITLSPSAFPQKVSVFVSPCGEDVRFGSEWLLCDVELRQGEHTVRHCEARVLKKSATSTLAILGYALQSLEVATP